MLCRNCKIEIADKALICYRCGTSTTEAKYQPFVAPPGPRRPVVIWAALAVGALLVLLAWFLLNS